MGRTTIYFVFIFSNLVWISTQLQESEHSHYSCYGTFTGAKLMDASCKQYDNTSVIAVKSLKAGSKKNSIGCPNEALESFTTVDEDKCCQPDSNSCDIEYSQKNIYQPKCTGRQTCQSSQAGQQRTDESCGDGFLEFSNYMYMEYYCIPERKIGNFESAAFSIKNQEMHYLQSPGYPTSGLPTSSAYTCSVETECGENVVLGLIDLRLEDKSSTCQQTLTVVDESSTTDFSCDDNNGFAIKENSFTSSGNYIKLELKSDLDSSNGYVWIGIKASGNLTINCPVQDSQYECPSTTTTESPTTTTEPPTTTTEPPTTTTEPPTTTTESESTTSDNITSSPTTITESTSERAPTTTPITGLPETGQSTQQESLSAGVIAGIAVGAIIAVILIVSICCCWCKGILCFAVRKKKEKKDEEKSVLVHNETVNMEIATKPTPKPFGHSSGQLKGIQTTSEETDVQSTIPVHVPSKPNGELPPIRGKPQPDEYEKLPHQPSGENFSFAAGVKAMYGGPPAREVVEEEQKLAIISEVIPASEQEEEPQHNNPGHIENTDAVSEKRMENEGPTGSICGMSEQRMDRENTEDIDDTGEHRMGEDNEKMVEQKMGDEENIEEDTDDITGNRMGEDTDATVGHRMDDQGNSKNIDDMMANRLDNQENSEDINNITGQGMGESPVEATNERNDLPIMVIPENGRRRSKRKHRSREKYELSDEESERHGGRSKDSEENRRHRRRKRHSKDETLLEEIEKNDLPVTVTPEDGRRRSKRKHRSREKQEVSEEESEIHRGRSKEDEGNRRHKRKHHSKDENVMDDPANTENINTVTAEQKETTNTTENTSEVPVLLVEEAKSHKKHKKKHKHREETNDSDDGEDRHRHRRHRSRHRSNLNYTDEENSENIESNSKRKHRKHKSNNSNQPKNRNEEINRMETTRDERLETVLPNVS